MQVSIIVATDLKGAIGKDNQLLWHLPADLKFFKEKTSGHHIIMGRKTYESIGRPLPNRTTIIISRNPEYTAEGCFVVPNLEEALKLAKQRGETEAMITGGAQIYQQAIGHADTIYLTEVAQTFEADTFFLFDKTGWIQTEKKEYTADEKNKFDYRFITLRKPTS
jgi:dihydrofolate reductase